MNAFEVIAAGPMTLVQDRGRPGLAHLGVGASGAFDRGAARLANRLVGNRVGAAVLEILVGGLEIRFDSDVWVALTGAWGPITAMSAVEPHTATLVPGGRTLRIGTAEHGIRWYLAVRGGIAANPVLGSRSRDTLAALGPGPLRDGDRMLIGDDTEGPVPGVDLVPVDPPADGTVWISLRPGPRADWFSSDAWSLMRESAWTTSPRSDRTGIRLEGPTLDRVQAGELASEGMIPGAIQVSPDGVPTILGVDAPVTGGYPVIAVVTDASLDALAQLRPGQPDALHPRHRPPLTRPLRRRIAVFGSQIRTLRAEGGNSTLFGQEARAASWRSAAWTTLATSRARVIGPTPPGLGESHPATPATAGSMSPVSFALPVA